MLVPMSDTNKLPHSKRHPPFIPEAQTLLIVVQTTVFGIPAPKAACLAGAWPRLALKTFPKKTSWTSAGSIFALLRAAENDQKYT